MSRQHPGLRSPRGVDLRSVPTADRSDRALHRAVAAEHRQPWRFSNRTTSGDDTGRFDLAGNRGTCYFASTAVGAILERVADPEAVEQPLISTSTLSGLDIWSGQVPMADRLADVTAPSVPQLTGEISTTDDYRLPWEWADAFDDDRRSGVLYRSRFAMEECVAVFGAQGIADVRKQPAVLTRTPATAFELRLPDPWREAVTRTPAAAESEQAPPP